MILKPCGFKYIVIITQIYYVEFFSGTHLVIWKDLLNIWAL